jgi:hypothetical protein
LLNTSTSTKAFTVSFYAKANESRAVALEVRTSHGTNRQIAKLFTITSSWQRFEFNVPAAASGMQFGNDTSNDLQLNWWQHAGSTYAGGTLSTDWEGATNANRAAGVGSLFASTSNFFEITGIQLEVGEQATPFEHRSFADELARCQRYYQKHGNETSTYRYLAPAFCNSTSQAQGVLTLPVTMRAAPTTSVSGNFEMIHGSTNASITLNTKELNQSSVGLEPAGSSFTANSGAIIRGSNDATAQLKLDAEL